MQNGFVGLDITSTDSEGQLSYDSVRLTFIASERLQGIRNDPPVSKGAENDNVTEDDYVAQRPSRVKTYEVDNERCGSFTLNVFLLVLLSAVPALAFGVLFTYIGYGATVHKFLVQQIEYARLVGYGGVLIFVLLYMLDVSYWHGTCFVVLRTCS